MSHPSLTPAEAERLEMLAEEANEVSKAALKILRHGYASYNPDLHHGPQPATNLDDLKHELLDVHAVVNTMVTAGDLHLPIDTKVLEERWAKKLKYTHHQKGSPK